MRNRPHDRLTGRPASIRSWLGVAGLVTVALTGCSGGTGGVTGTCKELLEAKEFELAVRRCSEQFETSGDHASGINAAGALHSLGQFEEVLAWRERLRGTDSEARYLFFEGDSLYELGRAREALASFKRAAAGFEARSEPDQAAHCHYWVHYIAWYDLSDYREALEALGAVYELTLDLEEHSLWATTPKAMFNLLFQVGDLETARWALGVSRDRSDPDDAAQQAGILESEGILRLTEGRYRLAEDAFEKCLALVPEVEDENLSKALARNQLLNLTENSLRMGDPDKARRYLDRARELEGYASATLPYFTAWMLETTGRNDEVLRVAADALQRDDVQPQWRWKLLHRLGRAAAASGDTRSAEAAFMEAIETVEMMRRKMAVDEYKSWLTVARRAPFDELFTLRASSGRYLDALEIFERVKARTLVDAIVESTSGASRGADESGPEPAIDRLHALQAVLPVLTRSAVANPVPVSTLVRELKGHRVLGYYASGDRFWLVVIGNGKVDATVLSASADQLRQMVRAFRRDLDNLDLAARLGNVLLPPESLADSEDHIHIVADDLLGSLPFAALRRNGRYLVQDFEIGFIPSLTSFVRIAQRNVARTDRPVVLGDPQGDLEEARREAEEIARRFGVPAHTGGRADVAALRASAGAPLLHVATHSGEDGRGPWLQLSGSRLVAGDILSAGIGPEVVILASCSGATREGRDMWGSLASAFLAAGSRVVVTTLRSVDDRTAREFVLDFYDAGGDLDPLGAVASVKRKWIAEGRQPAQWSPFVVLGVERVQEGG